MLLLPVTLNAGGRLTATIAGDDASNPNSRYPHVASKTVEGVRITTTSSQRDCSKQHPHGWRRCGHASTVAMARTTASYATSDAAVTIDLSASTVYATIAGDDASNPNRDTLTGIENLEGSESQATLLTGDAANNILSGGAGADTLDGGAGADTLNGGDGTDTASYATSDAAVTVDLSATAEGDGIFVSYATIRRRRRKQP